MCETRGYKWYKRWLVFETPAVDCVLVSYTDVTVVSDPCTQSRVVSQTHHDTTLVNMA